MRRVVYTKDVIAFSRPGQEILLDVVPLAEVVGIDSLHEGDESKNNFEASVDLSHAFQIRTKKDGFNAGRKYFIQASSDDLVTELISEISQITKAISKGVTAKSKWRKTQKRVRRFYNSKVFQGIATFLIIAVRFYIPVDSLFASQHRCGL
jgi:hypothetical protein